MICVVIIHNISILVYYFPKQIILLHLLLNGHFCLATIYLLLLYTHLLFLYWAMSGGIYLILGQGFVGSRQHWNMIVLHCKHISKNNHMTTDSCVFNFAWDPCITQILSEFKLKMYLLNDKYYDKILAAQALHLSYWQILYFMSLIAVLFDMGNGKRFKWSLDITIYSLVISWSL